MQNMSIFIENLNKQLELDLSCISQKNSVVYKYQQRTACYYEIILQLKSFVLNYSFSDLNEEIHFFKEIKPRFMSEFLYNKKVFQILISKPIGNYDVLLNYYENYLKQITWFFNTHQEFYQYYRLNSTYNDAIFFVRQKDELFFLTDASVNNFEPAFSSSHDFLVARIMSNDKLEEFLKAEIAAISAKNEIPHVDISQNLNLEWTDSKSDLIELIYALIAKGSINKGNCDIRQLAHFFELTFNVKLQDIYRTFQDIKIRSVQTKFIDSLKASFLKKIDEDFQ